MYLTKHLKPFLCPNFLDFLYFLDFLVLEDFQRFYNHYLLLGVAGEVVVHVPCRDRLRCQKAGHASLEPTRIQRVQKG